MLKDSIRAETLPTGMIPTMERKRNSIYRVLHPLKAVQLSADFRPSETTGSKQIDLQSNDLVSVDSVLEEEIGGGSLETRFARLSDGSGWIPTSIEHGGSGSSSLAAVEEVTVEMGLWSFYVMELQTLRRHPTYRLDGPQNIIKQAEYFPMQKIYCDRVIAGATASDKWFRVQGTSGWICSMSEKGTTPLLLDSDAVASGIFIFQAIWSIQVRSKQSTSEDFLTSHWVRRDDVVEVDLVVEDGDNRFLRLADGSGWLFTHKKDGTETMKELPVQFGSYELRVLTTPGSLCLRRNPSEGQAHELDHTFPQGSLLQADECVSISRGNEDLRYFRVIGTTGWVAEKIHSVQALDLLTTDTNVTSGSERSDGEGWTPDFVRGVAAALENVFESKFFKDALVLEFHSTEDVQMIVFCRTRTIGVLACKGEAYTWYRDCSSRQLFELLKMDMAQAMVAGGSIKRSPSQISVSSDRVDRDEIREEGLRSNLLSLDKEVEALERKRRFLVRELLPFDVERAKTARQAYCKAVEGQEKIAQSNKAPKQDDGRDDIPTDSSTASVYDECRDPAEDVSEQRLEQRDTSESSSNSMQMIATTTGVETVSTRFSRLLLCGSLDDHLSPTTKVMRQQGFNKPKGLHHRVSDLLEDKTFESIEEDIYDGPSPFRGRTIYACTQYSDNVIEQDDFFGTIESDECDDFEEAYTYDTTSRDDIGDDEDGEYTEDDTSDNSFDHSDDDSPEQDSILDEDYWAVREGPRRCKECKALFNSRTLRDAHCIEDHGFYCDHCERGFRSRTEFNDHREQMGHW